MVTAELAQPTTDRLKPFSLNGQGTLSSLQSYPEKPNQSNYDLVYNGYENRRVVKLLLNEATGILKSARVLRAKKNPDPDLANAHIGNMRDPSRIVVRGTDGLIYTICYHDFPDRDTFSMIKHKFQLFENVNVFKGHNFELIGNVNVLTGQTEVNVSLRKSDSATDIPTRFEYKERRFNDSDEDAEITHSGTLGAEMKVRDFFAVFFGTKSP